MTFFFLRIIFMFSFLRLFDSGAVLDSQTTDSQFVSLHFPQQVLPQNLPSTSMSIKAEDIKAEDRDAFPNMPLDSPVQVVDNTIVIPDSEELRQDAQALSDVESHSTWSPLFPADMACSSSTAMLEHERHNAME